MHACMHACISRGGTCTQYAHAACAVCAIKVRVSSKNRILTGSRLGLGDIRGVPLLEVEACLAKNVNEPNIVLGEGVT